MRFRYACFLVLATMIASVATACSGSIDTPSPNGAMETTSSGDAPSGDGAKHTSVGPGQFACGDTACDLASQYCFTDPGDGAQGPTSHCVARPSGCRSCDCIPDAGCAYGQTCTGDAMRGIAVTGCL